MPSLAVPPRFADRSVLGYEPQTANQEAAKQAAFRMVVGEIRNLVLIGPPGVGKTHLAAGIVTAIRERDEARWRQKADEMADRDIVPRLPDRSEWVNVADLIVRLRLEFDAPADDRAATQTAVRLHSHQGLVVLDDLGRERTSDWTGEVIYALVNARYESRLPTIVTSNLTAKELGASPYWPAISRLAEDGALVAVDGKDRRLPR